MLTGNKNIFYYKHIAISKIKPQFTLWFRTRFIFWTVILFGCRWDEMTRHGGSLAVVSEASVRAHGVGERTSPRHTLKGRPSPALPAACLLHHLLRHQLRDLHLLSTWGLSHQAEAGATARVISGTANLFPIYTIFFIPIMVWNNLE